MLTTKRPTQTTVLYTVSTRSPIKTITARASSYVAILLRLAAGLFITTILLREFCTSSTFQHTYAAKWLNESITETLLGSLSTPLILYFSWSWRMVLCAATTWLVFRKGYTEESLLVIRGLGVQTCTSSPSWLWTGSTRFIPTSAIQDVFIHEAFKGFEVRFYLSIVVEGEGDVVVVFPVGLFSNSFWKNGLLILDRLECFATTRGFGAGLEGGEGLSV